MTDVEMKDRALKVADAFKRERDRFGERLMGNLMDSYYAIASHVMMGEYHREGLFQNMVLYLCDLGFDMDDADTGKRAHSTSVAEAAGNAIDDTMDLFYACNKGRRTPTSRAVLEVVDKADDLMRAIAFSDYDIRARADILRDAVSHYLGKSGRTATATVNVSEGQTMTVGDGRVYVHEVVLERARELPKRVIFSPPATIAFWRDGAKTVAKCSEGDTFSEYVGLLVCIAKRNLKVSRHGTFEGSMARLLERAERPRAGGAA